MKTKLTCQLETINTSIKLKQAQMITAEAHTFTKVYATMISSYHSMQSVFEHIECLFQFMHVSTGKGLQKKLDKSGRYTTVPCDLLYKIPEGIEVHSLSLRHEPRVYSATLGLVRTTRHY